MKCGEQAGMDDGGTQDCAVIGDMPVEDVSAGAPGARQSKGNEEGATMVVDIDGSMYFSPKQMFSSPGVKSANVGSSPACSA